MNKNTFLSWIEEGVISIPSFLFRYYKKIGLTDIECMVILHIFNFIEKGKEFPTIDEIAERMVLSTEHCSQTILTLIQRGYLEILKGQTEEGIYFEKYSLKPLWLKLINEHALHEQEDLQFQTNLEEGSLFTLFEQEFARALSPIECETLSMWIDNDHHSPALIKAALKEAVLSGKLNFRYIDRILFEWKKAGIKTVEQAQDQSRNFRNGQQKNRGQEKQKKTEAVPFYNWLES